MIYIYTHTPTHKSIHKYRKFKNISAPPNLVLNGLSTFHIILCCSQAKIFKFNIVCFRAN